MLELKERNKPPDLPPCFETVPLMMHYKSSSQSVLMVFEMEVNMELPLSHMEHKPNDLA